MPQPPHRPLIKSGAGTMLGINARLFQVATAKKQELFQQAKARQKQEWKTKGRQKVLFQQETKGRQKQEWASNR